VLALGAPKTASTSVQQGGTQTVTGFGFSAGEQVSAELHSTPVSLGSVTASKAGTAIVAFTVPTALAPGKHSVVLAGATSGLTSTATFTVTAAPPRAVAPPASAPVTGVPILAATGLDGQQALVDVLIGLGLVAAGAGALYLGRRRRA
jgi:C4-dicarboxylate transporter